MSTSARQAAAEERPQSRFLALRTLAIPGFKPLMVDNTFGNMGFQARLMAQAWLVLEMTDSDALVGLANGLPAIPVIALALFGGVLADRGNRRVMLTASRLALAFLGLVTGIIISVNAVAYWHLLALAFGVSITYVFALTISQAMVGDIVDRESLFNANAIFGIAFNIATFAGPAVGGLLISELGVDIAFYAITGMFVIAALAATRIQGKKEHAPTARKSVLEDLKFGVSYIRNHPALKWLTVMGIFVMFAGSWVALTPRLAQDRLMVDAAGLGSVLAAQGVGGLVGAITLIVTGNVRSLARTLVIVSILFAFLGFAYVLSTSLLISTAIAFGFGFLIVWWANALRTAFMLCTTPETRGRVMSVFSLISQMLALSWLISGLVSELIGPQLTIAIGVGISAVFYTFAYFKSPALRAVGSESWSSSPGGPVGSDRS